MEELVLVSSDFVEVRVQKKIPLAKKNVVRYHRRKDREEEKCEGDGFLHLLWNSLFVPY